MKTLEVIAKAKNDEGKEVEVGRGKYTAFESNRELILYLQNIKVAPELKDRIRTDVNRQRKTDVRNRLAQEGKPVSDEALLTRGIKQGLIPKEEVQSILKRLGLKK